MSAGVPFALDGAGNAILYHVTPQLIRGLLTPATVCSSPNAAVAAAEETAAALHAAGLPVIRCVRFPCCDTFPLCCSKFSQLRLSVLSIPFRSLAIMKKLLNLVLEA